MTARWEDNGPAPPKAVAASKGYKDAVARGDGLALELTAAKGASAALGSQVAGLQAELGAAKAALAAASAAAGAGGGALFSLLTGLSIAADAGSGVAPDPVTGEGVYDCAATDPATGAGA